VKARDFPPCEPFIIQGRPSIDATGYFELPNPPGFAESLADHKPRPGRPETSDKDQKVAEAQRMHEQGKGYREIAKALGVSIGTVSGWFKTR
jgi:DNA invertase Pin-like site-specific DNA recombinase